MKKTFLAKRNALLTRANYTWGTLVLALVLCAGAVRLVAPNFFLKAAAPVLYVSNALAGMSHVVVSSFSDTAQLVTINDQLKDQNAALAAENQALRQQLDDLSVLEAQGGILAGVVARPPVSPYDTLVVAQGSRAGVVKGMTAFGAGGTPLGVADVVLTDFAYVTLFSAPGVQTAGWVGHEQVPVTFEGMGGGAFAASIARAAGVAVGDIVSVPGPGALPIGMVARVDGEPSSPSVTLRITPLMNLFSLTWVVLRTIHP